MNANDGLLRRRKAGAPNINPDSSDYQEGRAQNLRVQITVKK
jgi:hypothetical protein